MEQDDRENGVVKCPNRNFKYQNSAGCKILPDFLELECKSLKSL